MHAKADETFARMQRNKEKHNGGRNSSTYAEPVYKVYYWCSQLTSKYVPRGTLLSQVLNSWSASSGPQHSKRSVLLFVAPF
jgi:hypothetical protein